MPVFSISTQVVVEEVGVGGGWLQKRYNFRIKKKSDPLAIGTDEGLKFFKREYRSGKKMTCGRI